MSPINLGIIGLGNVGGGTLEILSDNAARIGRKLGCDLVVRAICSRSVEQSPPQAAAAFPDAKRVTDWRAVVDDPEIHIVAELIGGTGVAKQIVEAAIANGKSVVTANKELMALEGPRIWEEARAAGVRLAMEASVAGGIPILNVLREGIAGDRIQALLGILNGTCNFILTEMERRGDSLETVLSEAQRLGFAEADPTADVEGYDARSKLSLLAALAFGVHVRPDEIPTEGILRVRDVDFLYAKRIGRTVRLIASAEETEGGLLLAVRPALVPSSAILAHVSGSYNAVWVRGAHGADTFYYGRGAGPTPTGVAVVSDIMNVARELANGGSLRVSPFAYEALEQGAPADIDEEVQPYYLRFRVRDQPGIIADLAGILAEAHVSIDAVLQEPSGDKQDLPFVITLEPAPRRAVFDAVARMGKLDYLVETPLALPLLGALAD
ncbi:MAG: homoserine dehydrogenase [Bryobacterales bacterium]